MSDFWAKKLGGGQQPPPHVQPAQQQGGAWWQTPASVPVQPSTPHSGVPVADSAIASFTYQQLKSMKANEMDQDMMETLAQYELQGEKYNRSCPQCQSDNFIPAGVRAGSQMMSTDRCFECGAGARSPEPAVGGSGGKAGTATRQLNGGSGSYGHHISQLPVTFVPRGRA